MRAAVLFALLPLAACAPTNPDPRGVDKGETYLTISATGRADARPDEARLRLGVNSRGPNAGEASRLNRQKMTRVTEALQRMGVKPDDMQTQSLLLQRTDYGPERGTFQASNILEVRLTDMARVGDAVTAVTEAGANVLGGPELRVSDRESANRSAYAAAYKAARARAEAYAEAAGLEIVRVVNIVDGGEYGMPIPQPMVRNMSVEQAAAAPVAPPPPPGTPFSPGVSQTEVRVRVDFALKPA